MTKQYKLMDNSTLQFIAHHSCWCWYNLRMMYASYLFFLLAVVLIIKNRMTADTVSLILLYNWTQDVGFIMHIITCWGWFKRNCVETQRVFNLHKAPQEKIKGEDGSPKGWPVKGTLEFKDVTLRYRPTMHNRALEGCSFYV